uniref:Rhomboid domain-containing protein n=1 Tax=Macrostomum lignano TaxID=282301 RepID=A0A1I8FGK4_9PLAT
PGLSRWSLLGPYAVVLMLSSCVFAAWRIFGLASLQPAAAAAAAAAAGSRISLLGAENFLRLFADKPGLGPTVRAFSRPLLSPLGSALSHRTVGHFLASQLVLFGALTSCIGKMSPGEFVAFSVAAAYATSLASVLAMTLANRFVFSLGASGVLSALVAYNALTADQNVQLGQQQESGSSSPSSLALLGVIPLPWLTPAVGLSVWAGVEAVSWMVTVWRGRLPAAAAMPIFLCLCCRSRLLLDLASGSLPLLRPSRRCLKASPRPSPNGQQQQQRGQPKPKLFFRRIGQLAESPVSTEPLSLSAGGHAFQLAARAVAALAVGGLVSVMVSERRNRHRRDCASQLSQYDLGYVGIQEDDGLDKIVQDLRWTSPALLYCGLALAIHSLLGSRRMPLDKLAKLSRHALDQPGRSAILTSPWLSSILAFIAGSLTGSAFRCAYQQSLLLLSRERRPLGHWCGPHAGLAALVALHLLSLRSVTAKVQQQSQLGQEEPAFARSVRRDFLEFRYGLCSALLIGWAAFNLVFLVRYRRLRAPVLGPAAPALKHASTLAGLAAACGIHAAIEYRTQAVAELPAASDSAPQPVPAATPASSSFWKTVESASVLGNNAAVDYDADPKAGVAVGYDDHVALKEVESVGFTVRQDVEPAAVSQVFEAEVDVSRGKSLRLAMALWGRKRMPASIRPTEDGPLSRTKMKMRWSMSAVSINGAPGTVELIGSDRSRSSPKTMTAGWSVAVPQLPVVAVAAHCSVGCKHVGPPQRARVRVRTCHQSDQTNRRRSPARLPPVGRRWRQSHRPDHSSLKVLTRHFNAIGSGPTATYDVVFRSM